MKKIFPICLILIAISCSTSKNILVTNIHDLSEYPANSYIYALPYTRLAVTVTAIRHTTIPGPYSNYANQMLGIDGAKMLSETSWELLKIDLEDIVEPDPDYYYSLQFNDESDLKGSLPELSNYGLIMSPANFTPLIQFENGEEDIPEPIHFKDLSIKKFPSNFSYKKETEKKKEVVPIDLSIIKEKEEVKAESVKAKDAAEFIIKIRKRRFKLIAGQYEVYPEGEALATSVRELNRLEDEYLSLFIGRTYSDTIVHTYYYSPEIGNEIERYAFTRFSDETGFQDASNIGGKPLVLDIKDLQSTQALKQVRIPSSGPSFENVLLYRIPDKALIKIFYGSTTILEAELKIYQYGAIVPISLQTGN